MERLKKGRQKSSVPHIDGLTGTYKEKRSVLKMIAAQKHGRHSVHYGAYGHDKLSAMCVIMAQW